MKGHIYSFVTIFVAIYVVSSKWFAPSEPLKTILIWNDADRFESASSFGRGSEAFVRNKCPETRCQITTDRSVLPFERYDAVVMNMYGIERSVLPEDWRFQRHKRQRYVFLSQESPPTLFVDMAIFVDYFNWSMSYRHDADIVLRYGRVYGKNETLANRKRTRNYLERKQRSVVWMASHCETDSFRETYVDELSKYIDVDVYGTCGNRTCPRDEFNWISAPLCYDLLSKNYKFYLSFENSVCKEYVTEKFFEILARDIVPVVYGGADYAHLAPPHSFINALDYTPRQLARLLHRLAANETLYSEYFGWKDHYEVEAGAKKMIRDAYCRLCQKLHEDSAVKVYKDVQNHWNWNAECYEVTPWTIDNSNDLHPFM